MTTTQTITAPNGQTQSTQVGINASFEVGNGQVFVSGDVESKNRYNNQGEHINSNTEAELSTYVCESPISPWQDFKEDCTKVEEEPSPSILDPIIDGFNAPIEDWEWGMGGLSQLSEDDQAAFQQYLQEHPQYLQTASADTIQNDSGQNPIAEAYEAFKAEQIAQTTDNHHNAAQQLDNHTGAAILHTSLNTLATLDSQGIHNTPIGHIFTSAILDTGIESLTASLTDIDGYDWQSDLTQNLDANLANGITNAATSAITDALDLNINLGTHPDDSIGNQFTGAILNHTIHSTITSGLNASWDVAVHGQDFASSFNTDTLSATNLLNVAGGALGNLAAKNLLNSHSEAEVIGSALGSAIGTALIPIPGVGAFLGSVIGDSLGEKWNEWGDMDLEGVLFDILNPVSALEFMGDVVGSILGLDQEPPKPKAGITLSYNPNCSGQVFSYQVRGFLSRLSLSRR